MIVNNYYDGFEAVKKQFPKLDLICVPVAMFDIAYAICERESCKNIAELKYDYLYQDTLFGYKYKLVYIK